MCKNLTSGKKVDKLKYKMRIYPIAYSSLQDKRGVLLLIFAYTPSGDGFRKVAVKLRYPYWYYASLEKHTYDQVRAVLLSLSDARIGEKEETRKSTINPHISKKVVRILADSWQAKQESMRLLTNHRIQLHETDNQLSPLIKLLAEKNLVRYQWMELDVEIAAEHITKFEHEYGGNVASLRACTEEMAPPPFSIFSYDLETNSDDMGMPDATGSRGNAIQVAAITYADATSYQEHVIVYGMDTVPVFERFKRHEVTGENRVLHVHTVNTELELIRMIFQLIIDLDPDVITGHNILGFDNAYILERFTFMTMNQSMSGQRTSLRMPNFSRLREHSCSTQKVEWSNSQVSMKGIYFDTPGRYWVDTCNAAARQFFGQMKNNKLDTLARQHLFMSKNDVSYLDMFKTFHFTRDLRLAGTTFKRDDIVRNIRTLYEKMVSVHNRTLPTRLGSVAVADLNELISMYNGLNQRGDKVRPLTLNDALKIDVEERYLEIEEKTRILIEKWNIPVETDLAPEEMLRILWWLVAEYCLQDTRIPYQALNQQNLISVLREQASVFSVDISEVLLRGQVYTVTCSQYRYNYRSGFMMDFGEPGGPTGAYEYGGGYVNGEPGLKITDDDTIIGSLDFASLYPTIMIAHNFCYTTWVPPDMRKSTDKNYVWSSYEAVITSNYEKARQELEVLLEEDVRNRLLAQFAAYLQDGSVESHSKIISTISSLDRAVGDKAYTLAKTVAELRRVLNAPYESKGRMMCSVHAIENNGQIHEHWFLRSSVQQGIVSGMLWEQFLARKAIKKRMSAAFEKGDHVMGITYNAQQLAVKVSMNASYGALGTAGNRLACFPAGEAITHIGRESILLANRYVQEKEIGEIVYNDTDSGFVRVSNLQARFGKDPAKIKKFFADLANVISSLYPRPMSMEHENFFISMLVKGKKMYCAIKWDGASFNIADYTEDYTKRLNLFYIKGLAPVRRDKFEYNRQLLNLILHRILTRKDVNNSVMLLERRIEKIWALRNGFTNPQEVEKYFSYNFRVSPKASQGGDGMMAKWITIYERKYRQKPVAGDSFDLLVTHVSDGPDADKHTKAPTKMVTMDWLMEEGRRLDVIHYISAFEGPGNVVEILHLAYPESVPRNCITKYYLRNLRAHGQLHAPS